MGASLEIFSIHRRHIFCRFVCVRARVSVIKRNWLLREKSLLCDPIIQCLSMCALREFYAFFLRLSSCTKIHQLMHIQILGRPRHCCCCCCDLTHPQCFAYILYITEVIKINFWQLPNFLSYMTFLSSSFFFCLRLFIHLLSIFFYNIAYWFDGASLARFFPATYFKRRKKTSR